MLLSVSYPGPFFRGFVGGGGVDVEAVLGSLRGVVVVIVIVRSHVHHFLSLTQPLPPSLAVLDVSCLFHLYRLPFLFRSPFNQPSQLTSSFFLVNVSCDSLSLLFLTALSVFSFFFRCLKVFFYLCQRTCSNSSERDTSRCDSNLDMKIESGHRGPLPCPLSSIECESYRYCQGQEGDDAARL